MKISIIGAAGYVGSNIAVLLALNGLGDEIVLIDPFKPNLIAQLAMDATTAVSRQGIIVRAGEYADMHNSHIVITSAGAAQNIINTRMELLPQNLPIIRDLAGYIGRYSPDAVVITATNPVDPLNYAMFRFTGFDRCKIIGYSANDSIRFRDMVAQATGHKAADVEGMVMGEHGESQVLLFSSVKIKGQPVNLDTNTRQKIRSQVPQILRKYEELKTGRTAGVTTAVGMKDVVNAIVNNTHEVISCSAILSGEYGLHSLSMGVPLSLGGGGIYQIQEIRLSPEEQTYLNATLEVLQPAMRQVENFLDGSKQNITIK